MNAVTDMVRRTVSAVGERGAGDMRGPSGTNVNQAERALSMLIGSILVASGLKRRSLGGAVMALAGGGLVTRGVTGHSTMYQKLGLHTEGGRKLSKTRPDSEGLEITRAVTIGKPAEDLYRLWRDPQVQSRLLGDYGEVALKDGKHMHWTLHGPMGSRIEWDSDIVEERPNELLGWKTRPGAELPNEGSVQFSPAPGNRGTEVVLRMRFSPPGEVPAGGVMKLLGFIPKQLAYKALWRFKAFAETGEVPSIKLQPACRNDGRDR
jgi:uncharacterized membrane protein